jgi:hypothetical protein
LSFIPSYPILLLSFLVDLFFRTSPSHSCEPLFISTKGLSVAYSPRSIPAASCTISALYPAGVLTWIQQSLYLPANCAQIEGFFHTSLEFEVNMRLVFI